MVSRCVIMFATLSAATQVAEAVSVEFTGLAAALEADDACRSVGGDEDAKCALGLVQLRSRQLRDEAAQPLVKSEGRGAPADLSMSQHDKFVSDDELTQRYSLENVVESFQAYSYDHPDWLSECSSIFLDVGASIGTTVRKFFEAEKYPESPLLPHLEAVFGTPSERRRPWKKSGLCALGLEPNPRHYARHASIEAAYVDRGWHTHIYPYAAWFGEGVMSFNTTGKRDAAPDDITNQGAHLSSSFVGTPGASGLAVRTVDFAAFLKSLRDNAAKDATVDLMVMDIEGAEYETLGQLFHEKGLCTSLVKRLLVETHQWGEIQHWAASGQKNTRSFSEINRRLDQLRNSHTCANGVADVQDFSDTTYAQDVDEKFGSGHGRWREPSPTASQATIFTKTTAAPKFIDADEVRMGRSSSDGDDSSEEHFYYSGATPKQQQQQQHHPHHRPSGRMPTADSLEHEGFTSASAASALATPKTQYTAHAKRTGHVKHAGGAKLPTLADILIEDGESLPGHGSVKTLLTGSEDDNVRAGASGTSAANHEIDEANKLSAAWRLSNSAVSSSAAAKTQDTSRAKRAGQHVGNANLPTLADILTKDGKSLPETTRVKTIYTGSENDGVQGASAMPASNQEIDEASEAIPAAWRPSASTTLSSAVDAGGVPAATSQQTMHASQVSQPMPVLPAASQNLAPRTRAGVHAAGADQATPGIQRAGKAPKELDEVLAIVAGQASSVSL